MSTRSNIIVHPEGYDTAGFTDQNSLVRAMHDRPDLLTPIVTMLSGNYSNRFPLSFLTEGKEGGSKALNNIQYEYNVMGRLKTTEVVVESSYASSDTIGLYLQPVFIVFASKWFPKGSALISASGTQAYVVSEPVTTTNGTRYELIISGADRSATIPYSDVTTGALWGRVGGNAVAESRSMGTYEPHQTPGSRKNQLSILRQSYRLAGNISNKKVEFQIVNGTNGMTSYWLDHIEFQQMLLWKERKEMTLWTSKYNRDAFGNIVRIDNDLQQPVPEGSGLFEQIVNDATYTKLSEKLIRQIVGDVFRGVADTDLMEVVIFCGGGFQEEFDIAMKNSALFTIVAAGQGFTDNFVRKEGSGLQLGGYFTSYKHVDGHVITLRRLPFLDVGAYADRSGKHPTSSFPLSSYEAYFVDMSTYDGQKNLMMVHEAGRQEIRGVHQGMSEIKGGGYSDSAYTSNMNSLMLATEQDQSSIHYMCTLGIQMLRDTHSFKLLPSITGY